MRLLILLALVVACGGGVERAPQAASPQAAEEPAPRPLVPWRAHRIEPLGIALALIEGVETRSGAAPGGGYYLTQRHEELRLYVGYGRDVEADHLAARIAGAEEATSTVDVCGRPARRIDSRRPAAPSPAARGGRIGNPVAVHGQRAVDRVELLFEHHGVPVRVLYEVETAYRRLRLGDERHFLGSITCQAAPDPRLRPE